MRQDKIGTILAILVGVLVGLWAVAGCSPNAAPTAQQANNSAAAEQFAQLTLTAAENGLVIAEGFGVVPASDVTLANVSAQAAQKVLDTWKGDVNQPAYQVYQDEFNAAGADIIRIYLASQQGQAAKVGVKLHPH